MTRYYFIIEFISKDPNDAFLAGRCLSIMHGFSYANKEVKNQIGTFFPAWTEDKIGNAIGFVSSNQQALIGLSYQLYFAQMKEAGLFQVSPILEVPSDIPEVKFIRNLNIEKNFLHSKQRRLARVMRRAEARGEFHIPINRESRDIYP